MKVLLIEDNPDDVFLVEDALKKSRTTPFDLRACGALKEGLEALRSGEFEVILLDLSLPDSFGLETLKRTRSAASTVPVIVMTGDRDENMGLQALKEGAQDYLIKGQIPTQLLTRAIAYAVERERTGGELRNSLRETEVLLEEVHHRVKNNLQIICSLLSMQADVVTDTAVREHLRDSQNRVRSMALIHEQLYHSESLARVEFGGYLRQLVGNIYRNYAADLGAVSINLDVDPGVMLEIESAIPLGLIMNELASNAFKYAFNGRKGGELRIVLRRLASGNCCLEVRDNGPGLTPGFDFAKADSMGMKLVAMLARQIKTRLNYHNDGGAVFSFEFSDTPRARASPPARENSMTGR